MDKVLGLIKHLLEKGYCLLEPYLKEAKVTFDPSLVTANKSVNANDSTQLSFKNTGDVNATLNGFPLNAGDPMITFGVNRNERDISKYKIIFENPTTGVNPAIWVWKKSKVK